MCKRAGVFRCAPRCEDRGSCTVGPLAGARATAVRSMYVMGIPWVCLRKVRKPAQPIDATSTEQAAPRVLRSDDAVNAKRVGHLRCMNRCSGRVRCGRIQLIVTAGYIRTTCMRLSPIHCRFRPSGSPIVHVGPLRAARTRLGAFDRSRPKPENIA